MCLYCGGKKKTRKCSWSGFRSDDFQWEARHFCEVVITCKTAHESYLTFTVKDKGLTLWWEGFHGLLWVHIEERRGSWQDGLGDRAKNWHRPLPVLSLTRRGLQACHSEAWDFNLLIWRTISQSICQGGNTCNWAETNAWSRRSLQAFHGQG